MLSRTPTVVVTGATGQQGGAVARALLARGWRVRALTRHPASEGARRLAGAGAELVQGDLDDPATLDAAMAGAHGVFSVQTFMAPAGVGGEVWQGRAVARAAKRTGVAHVVYTSVGGADRAAGVPHFDSKLAIERELAALDVPTTVLRPTFFMDNFTAYRPEVTAEEVVVRLPLRPDTVVQLICVEDIGIIAADAFADPERYVGRTLELAGDELTSTAIARALGAAVGRAGRFEEVALADFVGSGMPYAHEVGLMFEWLQRSGYRADIAAIRELHPGLRTFADWLGTQVQAPGGVGAR